MSCEPMYLSRNSLTGDARLRRKKDDAIMNLVIGSQVKHKLVVSGLNKNDESCLCWRLHYSRSDWYE